MATSLFTGCGKGKSSQAQKNEVYATIKKSDQSASAAQICAWLSYRAKNNRLFQNEGIELSYCSDNLAVFSDSVGSVIYDRTKKKVIAAKIPSGTANTKDNTVMIKVLMIAGNTDAFSLVYFNSNNCEFKYGTPFTRI